MVSGFLSEHLLSTDFAECRAGAPGKGYPGVSYLEAETARTHEKTNKLNTLKLQFGNRVQYVFGRRREHSSFWGGAPAVPGSHVQKPGATKLEHLMTLPPWVLSIF